MPGQAMPEPETLPVPVPAIVTESVACIPTITLPPSPAATQKPLVGHDTAFTSPTLITSAVHAAAPPAGFVEVYALPLLSPATQSPVVGHDTACRNAKPAMLVAVQAVAPPVGLVVV